MATLKKIVKKKQITDFFHAAVALILKEKKKILSPHYVTNISFYAGALKNGLKCAGRWTINSFLTPCIDIHFTLIYKKMAYFLNGQFFLPKLKEWSWVP